LLFLSDDGCACGGCDLSRTITRIVVNDDDAAHKRSVNVGDDFAYAGFFVPGGDNNIDDHGAKIRRRVLWDGCIFAAKL
jgi:hypothetical protein